MCPCFFLLQTQERRVVQHLQFTNWPDHGTPKSLQHLVKFVRYMRKTHQSGPVIAHCSAGIGRSGVLLCVDIVLIYIEKDLCVSTKAYPVAKNERKLEEGFLLKASAA